jgi:hypothetical protein
MATPTKPWRRCVTRLDLPAAACRVAVSVSAGRTRGNRVSRLTAARERLETEQEQRDGGSRHHAQNQRGCEFSVVGPQMGNHGAGEIHDHADPGSNAEWSGTTRQ